MNSDKTDQDEFLVHAAQRDLNQFTHLYNSYRNRIFRYIRFRVARREDAEDLTSQTFVKAIEAFPNYTHRGYSFGAWLYKIAGNVLTDWYRKKKPLLLEDMDIDPENISHASLEQKVDTQIRDTHLVSCINQLSEQEKQVLVLKIFDEMSFREISNTLGKGESSVKMMYYRSLKKLRIIAKKKFNAQL